MFTPFTSSWNPLNGSSNVLDPILRQETGGTIVSKSDLAAVRSDVILSQLAV